MLEQSRKKVKEFFSNFANKYGSLFTQGVANAWSMMRYVVWFIVTDVMVVWSIISVKNWKVEDIPAGVVTIVVAAIGGKVLQVGKEKVPEGSLAVAEAQNPQPLNEDTNKKEEVQ